MSDSNGYNRPEGGWRYNFSGIKLTDTPDAIAPDKYTYAQNIRSYKENSIQTRPGYTQLFPTSFHLPITTLSTYAVMDTNNKPRILAASARPTSSDTLVFLDTGVLVATLNGISLGASMIPFRPGRSPETWMYASTMGDYKKFSVPDASDAVIVQNAGLEEPHTPPEATVDVYGALQFNTDSGHWTQSGVAGAPSNNDAWGNAAVVGPNVIPDPVVGPNPRFSVQVDLKLYPIPLYTVPVFDTSGTRYIVIVDDVIPRINGGLILTIQLVHYLGGASTGRCVIVPTQMPNSGVDASIFQTQLVNSLRRGALIVNSSRGSECCYVRSVTTGPDGTICFETSTAATFQAGDTIYGVDAVSCCGVSTSIANKAINSNILESAVSGAGDATLTQTFVVGGSDQSLNNPFNRLLTPLTVTPQQEDYIALVLYLSNVSLFSNIKLQFNLSTNGDAFYYAATPTQIVGSSAAAGTTPLSMVTQFPLSDLIRTGGDASLSLTDCISVALTLTATGAAAYFGIGALTVGGGGQPDVGDAGAPYLYAARLRSNTTGTTSNPSPITRYGLSPRRQRVIVQVTDDVYDIQATTWDFYRFGGSITTFRYAGTIKDTGGLDQFTDDFFDTSINAGDLIEYDNFQPWPSIDLPYTATVGTVGLITTTIFVCGTLVIVTYSGTNPADAIPANVESWLPGTLILLSGQFAYTLLNRPTISGAAITFNLVENAGSPTVTELSIAEPNVANRHLPYLFGPDAFGAVYAVGDSLRPGTFYTSKSYNPDSAPDTYNQELTDPSEPLIGGAIIAGLALVASTDRWWALYPQYPNSSTANRYQPVEKQVGRGLAAPFGHCTDGKTVYFWSKDGIWNTEGVSLTDEDLYNLFPHEGVAGSDVLYAGKTVYAPDYSRAGYFRLTYCNSFLYADYQDSNGICRTLVCDLTDLAKPAWSIDVYGSPMSIHYAPPQLEGTINTIPSAAETYPLLLLGDTSGNVHEQTPDANDQTTPIDCAISTFEYNAGDLRARQLFNDAWMDLTPVSGLDSTPISGGSAVQALTAIPPSTIRIQTNVPVGSELKYMGLLLSWTDDFSSQSLPTMIHGWQPMYQAVPVSVFAWKTQATSFGWMAYGHLRQWNFAYRSTADVTITVTAQDGTSPAAITLPSTSGAVQKIMIPFTFNKGQLYFFLGTSSEEWSPYLSESELYVGAWGRQDAYQLIHDIDAPKGIRS